MSKLKKTEEGKFYHEETGELYTKEQLEKINNKKMFESHNEYLKNAIEYGLETEHGLRKIPKKESNKKSVKEGYKFNMMHETDLKEIMLSGKLSEKECAFIGRFTPFICFPDNDIQIRNEYLTIEELGKILGYSKNVMTKIIKNLEQEEIIKVVKAAKRPPVVYINPFLYSAGREVSNDTYDMFCKSIYNPDVSHYA